jgi:hypothetical protein
VLTDVASAAKSLVVEIVSAFLEGVAETVVAFLPPRINSHILVLTSTPVPDSLSFLFQVIFLESEERH